MYESFQILIDDPAATLALGFDDYAAALAEVATVSRPQFAIGIFGPWGSGKSTLMKAIRADVAKEDRVVPIWFNAWRYEKEEHLIVPLLDSLREQILDGAEKLRAFWRDHDFVRFDCPYGDVARFRVFLVRHGESAMATLSATRLPRKTDRLRWPSETRRPSDAES